MGILSKDIIAKEVLVLEFLYSELVECILHRLKKGCQSQKLPTRLFFVSGTILDWNTVYYHFNKWSKVGCWKQI